MRISNIIFGLIAFLLLTGACPVDRRVTIKAKYLQEVGVREATGKNDGKSVEKYLRTTNLGKGYAWCAAFVNYVLKESGAKHNNSAWSPAWFPSSRVIYTRGQKTKQVPQHGDVFGIWFQNRNRIAHVGFVHEWGSDVVITVEGNTNDAGSREGDGVYKKRRLKRQIYQVAQWVD